MGPQDGVMLIHPFPGAVWKHPYHPYLTSETSGEGQSSCPSALSGASSSAYTASTSAPLTTGSFARRSFMSDWASSRSFTGSTCGSSPEVSQ